MKWRAKQKGDICYIKGFVDEYCDLERLFKTPPEKLILNLRDVVAIEFAAIRAWVDFVRDHNCEVIYQECSVSVIEAFNQVPEAVGKNSRIDSFYARFYCDHCDNEDEVSLVKGLNFDEHSRELPNVSCSSCGATTQFDHDEKEYFSFLKAQQQFKSAEKVTIRRKALKTLVEIRSNSYGNKTDKMFCENISRGGLFCIGSGNYPLGSQLHLSFSVPLEKEYKVEATCEVKWLRSENVMEQKLPGVGFEFIDLAPQNRKVLNEYLGRVLKSPA